MHPGDDELVRFLRKSGKRFCLAVNKIDGHREDLVRAEFFSLGIESMFSIAAKTGRGVRAMLSAILLDFKDNETLVSSDIAEDRIKLAVIGRPNVGKSTLINGLLGEDRMVVFDQPGTTRDSIYVNCEWKGKSFTFIDTAGARRRSRIDELVEKYSIAKTLQAISNHKYSNVLENMGSSDITHNINFNLYKQIINKIGGLKDLLTTQKKFLIKMGIEQRAEIISRNKNFLKKADIYYRLKRLIGDDQMGNLFKVMLIKNKKNKFKLGF